MRARLRDMALLLGLTALPACGGGGRLPPLPTPARLVFHVESGWVCVEPEDCQDVFDVMIEAGTEVTVAVTQVTGPSVVRLALYGPGMPLGGLNLLTNSTNDRRCALANASDSATALAESTGTYRVAVGRDWGFSSGASGTYTLDVFTDRELEPVGQTVDDQPTQASGAQCP